MKCSDIMNILAFGGYCYLICLAGEIFGWKVESFTLLSMVFLVLTAFYYLLQTLEALGFKDYSYSENYFKFLYCGSFLIGGIYLIYFKINNKQFFDTEEKAKEQPILNIMMHGGSFVFFLIEHFIWNAHTYATKLKWVWLLILGAILASCVCLPWYFCEYAMYSVLRDFKAKEYVITYGVFSLGMGLGGLVYDTMCRCTWEK